MVALRQYKPQNLNINPAAVATQLAEPIDVNGVLKQLTAWNALANNESQADFNQTQAEEKQRDFELKNSYDEQVKSQLEAGIEPSQIDEAEIYKTIGDTEKLLKLAQMRAQAELEAPMKEIEARTKLGKLNELDPQAAMTISQRLGYNGWKAPPQKSKEGKEKEDKPEVVVDPKTGQAKIINVPEGDDVPLDVLKKAKEWNENNPPAEETPEPQAGPGITERVSGFLSSLTGGQATPAATPAAAPSIPPGMKLQRNKATGQTRLVPING